MSESGSKLLYLLMALCVITTVSCLLFTVSEAMTGYRTVKPLLVGIEPEPSEVKFVSLQFDYDALTNTFPSAEVAVYNAGPNPVNATISVKILDVANERIAFGQATTTNINVTSTYYANVLLTWNSGKSVSDYAGATVAIS